MRIRGGSGRVVVEVPKKKKERKPPRPVEPYFQDGFDVAPPKQAPSKQTRATTQAVVRDLATQGKSRVKQDEQRDEGQLVELGRLMGALTGELVTEVINHFVQKPAGQRSASMVVLGALTGALLVEFWSVLRGDDALERALSAGEDLDAALKKELGFDATEVLDHFVTFIEDTEGQPARRMAGTLYSVERRG